MKAPQITVVDSDVVLPFLAHYLRRWNLPASNIEGYQNALWFGAWRDGTLRAVMGLQGTDEPDTLLVFGFCGDGSGTLAERRAIYDLISAWDGVPIKLIGYIHLPNTRMYRYAAKKGWDFLHVNDADDFRGTVVKGVG